MGGVYIFGKRCSGVHGEEGLGGGGEVAIYSSVSAALMHAFAKVTLLYKKDLGIADGEYQYT